MTDLRGPTINCPRGHVVATAEITSRDGLLVCPHCDRVDAAVDMSGSGGDNIDVWRRPGSASPAPAPAEPAAAPSFAAPTAEPPAAFASERDGVAPADPVLPPPAASPQLAPPAAVEPVAAVAAPRSPVASLLQAPLALIAASIVVTLTSSCFFVVEAIQLSDAGDVGGTARLTGTILAAAGNLVLALAVAWIVVLLGRSSRGT